MNNLRKKRRTALVFLAALGVIVHLLPFILYGPHPLGYDTGFYRRYLIQPFHSFPNTAVPGLGENALFPRIFLDVLRLSHLPPDLILYGSYILLLALSTIALFYFVENYWGLQTGILAALIFVLSPIQYAAFWFILWKNAFATLFLLLAFLAIEKRSRWALPLGIIIVASHQTTAVIFLLTLLGFIFLNREKRKELAPTFFLALAVFLFLHLSFYKNFRYPPVASFITSREFLSLSWPLIVLAFFGIRKIFFYQPRSILVAFGLIVAAFPVLSLPFYERIFIFTDIFAIVAAAVGLNVIKSWFFEISKFHIKAGLALVAAITAGSFLGNTYSQIRALQPLVSAQELSALSGISETVSSGATILTSSQFAPWVEGWSQNKVIAPGLLGDRHNFETWLSFWNATSSASKIQFLNEFPKPLYFFLSPGDKPVFLPQESCVIQRSEFIFENRC